MSNGLIVVPHAVDEVVLVTQTCDLQETTSEEPHCLVAPVLKVSTDSAWQVTRGHRPRFVGLPWRDDQSIGDLSLITVVDRSLLVGATSLGNPRTSRERLHFADMAARYLTRPAIANHINEVLAPSVQRIGDRYDRQSAEGRCLEKVAQLRLEANPDFDSAQPALTVLVLIEEEELPSLPAGAELDEERIDRLIHQGLDAACRAALDASDPVAKREAWIALAELWFRPSVELADQTGAIGELNVEVMNGEELSYGRSRNAPILDLGHLSTCPPRTERPPRPAA